MTDRQNKRRVFEIMKPQILYLEREMDTSKCGLKRTAADELTSPWLWRFTVKSDVRVELVQMVEVLTTLTHLLSNRRTYRVGFWFLIKQHSKIVSSVTTLNVAYSVV